MSKKVTVKSVARFSIRCPSVFSSPLNTAARAVLFRLLLSASDFINSVVKASLVRSGCSVCEWTIIMGSAEMDNRQSAAATTLLAVSAMADSKIKS